jgi:hypothetical protein
MRRVFQIAILGLAFLVAPLAYGQRFGGHVGEHFAGRGVQVGPARPIAPNQALFGPPATIFSPQAGMPFGPPPSVTSLGPTGYTFAPCVLGNCGHGHFNHGYRGGYAAGYGGYPVFIPYYTPDLVPVAPMMEDSNNSGYALPPQDQVVGSQGGGYPIMYSGQRHATMAPTAQQSADLGQSTAQIQPAAQHEPPAPVQPQDTTVLVFKDGHKLDVTNYAIQGDTLFNFSAKGPRRIALADLDLKATTKINDDNGVQFRLP